MGAISLRNYSLKKEIGVKTRRTSTHLENGRWPRQKKHILRDGHTSATIERDRNYVLNKNKLHASAGLYARIPGA